MRFCHMSLANLPSNNHFLFTFFAKATAEAEIAEEELRTTAAEAEETWSKKTREGKSPVTPVGKYQQPPKKQLKIDSM